MPYIILIVDDCENVRAAVRGVLSCLDAEFREASNGVEALLSAQSSPPDLILLDLTMPGMGGAETAKALKSAYPSIPIVMFTMHNLHPSWAQPLNVDAVLSKAAGFAEVIDCVRSLLTQEKKPTPILPQNSNPPTSSTAQA